MDVVHTSVMRNEVLEYLEPVSREGLLVDATLGEGGHAEMFLQAFPGMRVVGLDADRRILEVAKSRLDRFGDRVRFYNAWFNTFFREYPLGDERPDAILFDLGISTFHYERSTGGFSFRRDEKLDMRLSADLETSARDIVNEYPEEELRRIFGEYGEERYSGRIAKAIVTKRRDAAIESTGDLAEVIAGAVPGSYRHGRIHPGTRCFQALRIAVNGELARLDPALRYAFSELRPGGRMAVISFHSLEDRIVKHFFREKAQACTCPPETPICKCGGVPAVDILTKKPLRPTEDEIDSNAASRSAKLRVVEKKRDEEYV